VTEAVVYVLVMTPLAALLAIAQTGTG